MKRFYFGLILVLLVAACGPALAPDDVENVFSEETVIVYGSSGGFAGLQQEWTIHTNGQIDFPDGSQKQADSEQVLTVFDAVQAANFQSLNTSYLPEDTCCDLFTYTVTVQTGSEAHTITTMDNAPDVPDGLTAVLQTLDELIQNAK
ncbi:MAG: hypothetical protein H6667_14130 [Ardenticatenaceae bacterium]|nr:hypothetical protein [Ardenticatenaceae bacterium]MCB9444192.1 hypothetical protein [Ardenticatenaceae bacterium]